MSLHRAWLLALLAGLLLLAAHATGGSALLTLGERFSSALLPGVAASLVNAALGALLFIGSLGGLAVLAGALLYRGGHARSGGLFVLLGAGTGLLGLLALAAVAAAGGKTGDFMLYLLGPAGLGVVLSIVARREARKA